MTTAQQLLPPLDYSIVTAVAGFIERSAFKEGAKRPSHSDLGELFSRCGIAPGDPTGPGKNVGKQKRVDACLTWAIANNPKGGKQFVAQLIGKLQGWGGFNPDSENFIGRESIENACKAFTNSGWDLHPSGSLLPANLETLSGATLTEALAGYAKRAMEGADDSALVTGAAKDLLEATARHVLIERGRDRREVEKFNFPTLLGMAFIELDMATQEHTRQAGEPADRDLERALHGVALAINKLRNHAGAGHGRPWLPNTSRESAATAARASGVVARRLLAELEK